MPERHQKARGISPLWILGLATLVRAVSLNSQGLWRDEVDQWRFALQSWSDMVQNFIRAGWNGPLYSPMLRIWIALTGDSTYAMRYFSLLWGVLSVALMYTLARRMTGRKAAMWSALLMTLSPYMVWYAQEIKMYTWVPMLVLLALYALDRACEQPRWGWWVTVLVATSLAVYSHILAALLIPVEFVWFWLHPRRHPEARRGGLLVLLLLTVPYLPAMRWQARLLLQERETGYPSYTLGQMAMTLLNGWSSGICQGGLLSGWFAIFGTLFFGALALVGVGWLAVWKRAGELGALVTWLALPLLILWLVSLRGSIFTDRYLIWSAPAFYFLAGIGMATLQKLIHWLILLLLAVVMVLNGVALYDQAVYPVKPQFAPATRYVQAHRGPDELLLFQIPYNHYVMDYYDEGVMDPWAEAPYTNWKRPGGGYQVDEAYVGEEMRRIVEERPGVWLVYSEAALWDERELVRRWLNTHYALTEEQHFQGVDLYHYVQNDSSP